jgi:LPXTG-motif cell wall-anchored protein
MAQNIQSSKRNVVMSVIGLIVLILAVLGIVNWRRSE